MHKERCSAESCRAPLTLTSTACKCQKKFCSQHRHAESHACTFDYRASAKETLMKTIGKPVVAEKISIL